MKKVAIYGGTFNPIHNGHIVALQTLLDQDLFDEVHLMPAGIPPFKETNPQETIHRFAMCELVSGYVPQLIFNNTEGTFDEPSYTYKTLKHLQQFYGNYEYYWVIGYDNLYILESWYKGRELLSEFNFIVFNRGGFRMQEALDKISELQSKYNTKFVRIDMPMIELSSTEIRERINQGRSIHGFVPLEVEEYIIKHNLY